MYSIIVHIVLYCNTIIKIINEEDHIKFIAVRFPDCEVTNLMTLCFYENKIFIIAAAVQQSANTKNERFIHENYSICEYTMFKLCLV